MSISLSITDVEKNYGGRKVLGGCSATFKGGVTALMGPNGSGKSTLLRICALLEMPTSGIVRYFDNDGDLEHDISLRRKITMVLHGGGIFNTSVLKNVAYGLKVRGIDKTRIDEKVHEVLDLVGLRLLSKQNARDLSSGEAQRLALARAMVIEPEVLFLDEPTVNIDEQNREAIEEMVLEMKKRGSPTVVITTHDRDQANRLADRILTMKAGQLAW
jgi:tungstate transport system ATP-binding protein